jgi:hypothetical protein
VRSQRSKDRGFKVLNIEQQNNKPQNDEVITSIFPPEADSIFCGSRYYLPTYGSQKSGDRIE